MGDIDQEIAKTDPAPEDPGQQPLSQPDREAQPVYAELPPRLPFAVVGVGASAGGLEAFGEFLKAMPSDSGMAFVFILHLAPDRHSLVAEVLSRHTKMHVAEVIEGMEVVPNHVYVIRPAHVLTIKDGHLHLGPRLDGPRAANRPVDDFFKSLAQEQRERAIAIIMSGMGSNGSAGAQAIKAVGGLCIAQDPETAQFPSMPRHLIDAGYADFISRLSEMPEVLLQYASHPYTTGEREADAEIILRREQQHMRELLAVLRTRTKQDFNAYKKPTVLRRVQRRMGLARVENIADYARLLRQSPTEVAALADDLLIHVTGFFRDPEMWETLQSRVIAPLIAGREDNSSVRCWVTACSSGEEAYSLAMLLAEEVERSNKHLDIKVFATDMAERTLSNARNGTYPGGIESDIPPERLQRFFEKEDSIYRVRQELRQLVVFAPQNVLQDPPFSQLDIATCRNLLIYLEPEVQQRVLSLLHFGLREGGALFLGTSETLGGSEDLFEPVDKKARIFRRVGPTRHGMVDFPLPHALRVSSGGDGGDGGNGGNGGDGGAPFERRLGLRPSVAQITQRTLLEHHLPAAVLVDRDSRILYFQGNTRPFLEHPSGEPTRDLMVLAREGVRGSVRIALHRAISENGPATAYGGWLENEPGDRSRISVTASPVFDKLTGDYFVVSFRQDEEVMPSQETNLGPDRGRATADDMRRMRDELQSTVEELQTSNEELKASHEEVVSINEELQSTNEELETSKEEMQSLNEELSTINTQLQAKIEEHLAANNDLASLLSSTDIGVLFLDRGFRIRRFTPALGELMELIASDVGRPLSDLHLKFDDPSLFADAQAVLGRLVPAEREINVDGGHWYLRRITPYRTADNRIDGVVISFLEITARKRAALEVTQAREYAEGIVETVHEPLLVLHSDLTVKSANRAFYRHFKVKQEDTAGRKIYGLGNGQWDIPALRTALEEVLPAKRAFEDFEVIHDFQGLGQRVMKVNGRQLNHDQLILLEVRDVTREYEITAELQKRQERFRRMVNIEGVGVLIFDQATGVLIDANDAFLRMSGYGREEVTSRALSWRELSSSRHVTESAGQPEAPVSSEPIGLYEKEYVRKDGGKSLILFGSATLGDGTVAEYWIDITARRAAENAVRDGEERFRLLVDGTRDFAMVMLNATGRIAAWNIGAERLLGFTENEAIGQPGAIIFTPEDRAADVPAKELVQAAATGRATDERWHIGKDGIRFWGSGVISVLRNPEGSVRGFVKILRDESNRKQAEEAEKAALEAAELANRTKDEFLATLSHELRTPLSAILLWAKMLHSESEPASLDEGLAAIRNSADAQKQLIEDLLDTSRITSGHLRLEMRPTDLTPVVDSAVEAVLQTAQARDVKIVVDIDSKIGTVRIDPDRIRQVIWNLLTNAIKFTPSGGKVKVALLRRGQEVELRVTDTGKGIDSDFLPHMFELFRQADATTTRSHGGLGLGLAICKKLVEQHGGTITAKSDGPGRGATFTVTLPLPSLGSSAQSKAKSTSSADQQRTKFAGIKILLVEDERETRNALTTALRSAGAKVTAVDSAAAAIESYPKSKFDLLVSDIGMPGEDGYSLIRRLRSMESSKKAKRTPALALTAFVSEEDRRKALGAGYDRHLGKPVEPDQLISVLIELAAKP